METSTRGLDLISEYEGFSATPYLCQAGRWTLGIGCTRLPNGEPVTAKSPRVTRQQAEQMLRHEVKHAEAVIAKYVKVPLRQNQYDALVSWIYNLGEGNFASSTLLRLINNKQFDLAVREFPKWDIVNGVRSSGLDRRRAAEAKLFGEP